jgi:hypothetical protein
MKLSPPAVRLTARARPVFGKERKGKERDGKSRRGQVKVTGEDGGKVGVGEMERVLVSWYRWG